MIVFFLVILGGAAAWIWRKPLVEYVKGMTPEEAKKAIEVIVPPEPAPKPVPMRRADQPPLLSEDAAAALGPDWTSPKDGLKYVWIPQTWYLMGCASLDEQCEPDEKPAHTVGIAGFWLGATEVPISAWKAYLGATQTGAEVVVTDGVTPNAIDDAVLGRQKKGVGWAAPLDPKAEAPDEWPVSQVSWSDAEGYCRWIGGRLPTEAEWEMAARERDKRTTFAWGDEETPSSVVANLADRELIRAFRVNRRVRGALFASYDDKVAAYAPVDAFPPNEIGIAGLAGNVREWMSDVYGDGFYSDSPEEDPKGPPEGELRVVRGGSWASEVYELRLSNRQALPSDTRSPVVGFRCAFDK